MFKGTRCLLIVDALATRMLLSNAVTSTSRDSWINAAARGQTDDRAVFFRSLVPTLPRVHAVPRGGVSRVSGAGQLGLCGTLFESPDENSYERKILGPEES